MSLGRAILFVMDSFGIGGAPDATLFGSNEHNDEGANTFGNISERCRAGACDVEGGGRAGPLNLPNLVSLGLVKAANLASAYEGRGFDHNKDIIGLWGAATERSRGKDTPSGHWELAGVPVTFDWGYFPKGTPSIPQDLRNGIYEEAGLTTSLCNDHASGLAVIRNFGHEHIKTGYPIFYTSTDSVLQIAAHEEIFGRDELYRLCEITFRHVAQYKIARVIARPFTGDGPDTFIRTDGRRDYSVPPPEPTLLDRLNEAGRKVLCIGKVADIFAHRGPTQVFKASGNDALFAASLQATREVGNGDLIFTNFVDFDQLYGHRRDVTGYATALEAFDEKIGIFMSHMNDDDLLIITADHGCDPTWRGTDHTRERVPVLVYGKKIKPGSIGIRDTFADVGESIAHWLDIQPGSHGKSFLA